MPVSCEGHKAGEANSANPHVLSGTGSPYADLISQSAQWRQGEDTEVTSLPVPMDFWKALIRRRRVLGISAGVAVLAGLIPIAVLADDTTATQAAGVAADTVWVIVAACLVMFMQAGFAMLEVGFSRMKNVGTVVAKVVTNLSVSSIAYWAVGFGFAFGAGGLFAFIGGRVSSRPSAPVRS